MKAVGDRVYVAEWGHGARAGKVIRVYVDRGAIRIVVQLDDQPCPRDCFGSSVFADRDRAERAAAE